MEKVLDRIVFHWRRFWIACSFFIGEGSGWPFDCFWTRQCFADLEAPKALLFPCPISRKEEGQRIEVMGTMEFLPPHSWVLALEQGGLLQELTCNDKDLKIFWESQEDSPQMSRKLWSGLDWNHLPIPYVLHGDGAPFTEVDSLQVISFRCLLTKRAISESQLMIAAWPKQSATPATGKVIMEWLAWSFGCLFEGQTPKKDKDGRAIEEGRGRKMRKGIVWAITGDLEWFASEFGFPYSASNLLCGWCLADQKKEGTVRPFTDCRKEAKWRSSILTPKELDKKFGGHPLFQVPSVSTLTIKLDVLHVLDLGVAAYLHGSALASIMEELGGSSRNLFKTIWPGLDSLFTAQVCTWAGKPFYCTGLHMGWIAFLLHSFALGLESLFTAQVFTYRLTIFFLHM